MDRIDAAIQRASTPDLVTRVTLPTGRVVQVQYPGDINPEELLIFVRDLLRIVPEEVNKLQQNRTTSGIVIAKSVTPN